MAVSGNSPTEGVIESFDNSVQSISGKCKFCDVTLRSDVDISRHLVSVSHIGKRDNFLSLHNPRNKEVEKQVPKNLSQVFESLKLRDVKDLKDLANKGYFTITDPNMTEIAEEITDVLITALTEYHSRNLSLEEREGLRSVLKRPDPDTKDQESSEARKKSKTRHSTPPTENLSVPPPANKVSKAVPPLPKPVPVSVSAPISRPAPVSRPEAVIKPVPVSVSTPVSRPARASRPDTVLKPVPVSRPPSASNPTPASSKSINSSRPPQSKSQNRASTSRGPVPDPHSTYKPILAKIKVEPKDD